MLRSRARSDSLEVGLEENKLFFERGGRYGRHAFWLEKTTGSEPRVEITGMDRGRKL
jgi:hypothetical protein